MLCLASASGCREWNYYVMRPLGQDDSAQTQSDNEQACWTMALIGHRMGASDPKKRTSNENWAKLHLALCLSVLNSCEKSHVDCDMDFMVAPALVLLSVGPPYTVSCPANARRRSVVKGDVIAMSPTAEETNCFLIETNGAGFTARLESLEDDSNLFIGQLNAQPRDCLPSSCTDDPDATGWEFASRREANASDVITVVANGAGNRIIAVHGPVRRSFRLTIE